MKPRLVVFCKWPEPGTVKTRLGAELGMAEAATLYRCLVEQTLKELQGDWQTIVAFAPPERADDMVAWLGECTLEPQVDGDLGARMLAVIDGPTVIVGTDCPALSRQHVASAIEALTQHDLVLGPTLDNGYYLIALNAPQRTLFDTMPWSSEAVLPETRRRADAAGLKRYELEILRDLDDLDDYNALKQSLPVF